MRRPHRLKRNKATQIPANCIWVDTETKARPGPGSEEHHYLWFGWACFQRRREGLVWTKPDWFRFETRQQFWEWVMSKTRPQTRLYLFAHNWAFDGPVLGIFTELPDRGWTISSAIVEAPPFAVTWKKERMSIQAVDTLNLWRVPLKTLGESIGQAKLEMPRARAPVSAWDSYGKQDVEIIRVACLQWFAWLVTNDLGGFAVTLASQAVRCFRHRFMEHDVFIDNDVRALEMSRAAYVGGRTECFRVGEYAGDFYYVDVNGLYPAVMQEGLFPCKLRTVVGRPRNDLIEKWKDQFSIVVECDVRLDSPIIPLVFDGKLVFPVGHLRVFLSGPEFYLCWDRGLVTHVERAAVYEQAPLFAGFVEYFYTERLKAKEAGDPAAQFMHKILMNSLYGKFGQRGRVFDTVDIAVSDAVRVWSEIDLDSGDVKHLREFGGIRQEFQDEGEARDSFPAIAACVTSRARLKLLEAIELAGWDEVYYCDTDSLVVSEKGYKAMQHLVDSQQLGMWKLEGVVNQLTLHGPKDYIMDGEKKTKGVRRTAEWLDDKTVVQDQFVGFKGLLRRGSLDAPVVFPIKKRLNRVYNKGTVDRSGRVRPLRIDSL